MDVADRRELEMPTVMVTDLRSVYQHLIGGESGDSLIGQPTRAGGARHHIYPVCVCVWSFPRSVSGCSSFNPQGQLAIATWKIFTRCLRHGSSYLPDSTALHAFNKIDKWADESRGRSTDRHILALVAMW